MLSNTIYVLYIKRTDNDEHPLELFRSVISRSWTTIPTR